MLRIENLLDLEQFLIWFLWDTQQILLCGY